MSFAGGALYGAALVLILCVAWHSCERPARDIERLAREVGACQFVLDDSMLQLELHAGEHFAAASWLPLPGVASPDFPASVRKPRPPQ